MTKEEKIIATAFTGIMFIDGSDMGSLYEYMEKKVGHGVFDLMLADKGFWKELHKACDKDFTDMVSKEQPSLPSNLDEAAEKQGEMVDNYGDPYGAVVDAFKAGAEWMAGQGEVQEHFVIGHTETSHGHPVIVHYPESFEIGDNVIVQIRKKEE